MNQPTITTQICLVSDQPVPNLTPLLDGTLRPQRVILLVGNGKERQAGWLEGVIRRHGLKAERWNLGDAWDIPAIQHRVLELLERMPEELGRRTVALNATGGTKPMSIAAYEAFRAYELPVFYVHPERDRLIWIHPEGRPAHELADRVRLEAFLEIHGARPRRELRRSIPDPEILEIGAEIVARIDRFGTALAQLNWLAASAEGSLRSKRVEPSRGPLVELIELFEQGGYLQREDDFLRFPGEQSRFLVNGGWLEFLAFDAVRSIRHDDPHIQDIAFGVEVEREQNGNAVRNELDVVFLRNNRLHIIECKTRRFHGKGEGTPGAEALYKLDSLRDLMGGLQARAMLLSFQEMGRHHHTRARDLGIRICAGAALRRLREHLQRFIQ